MFWLCSGILVFRTPELVFCLVVVFWCSKHHQITRTPPELLQNTTRTTEHHHYTTTGTPGVLVFWLCSNVLAVFGWCSGVVEF